MQMTQSTIGWEREAIQLLQGITATNLSVIKITYPMTLVTDIKQAFL